MPEIVLSPPQRLLLALYAFFAVLFRADVASAVARVRDARRPGALPSGASPPAPGAEPARPAAPGADARPALQLLAALQREGRLVDFLEEDLSTYADADVGAAARTIHAGCKRALAEMLGLEPVLREPEGAQVTVERGFDPAAIRLTGNVVGQPPFRGALRHHGWRAREVRLPPPPDGDGSAVLAPAEVEL